MTVNACCGVVPSECKTKHNVFNQVMKVTNISLNADVSPVVKERQVRWTTHANLFCMVCEFPEIFDRV
jgi:hypothetical protein